MYPPISVEIEMVIKSNRNTLSFTLPEFKEVKTKKVKYTKKNNVNNKTR